MRENFVLQKSPLYGMCLIANGPRVSLLSWSSVALFSELFRHGGRLVTICAKQPASRVTYDDSRRDEEEENDQTEQHVQCVHAVVVLSVQQVTFGRCEDRGKEGQSHCYLK